MHQAEAVTKESLIPNIPSSSTVSYLPHFLQSSWDSHLQKLLQQLPSVGKLRFILKTEQHMAQPLKMPYEFSVVWLFFWFCLKLFIISLVARARDNLYCELISCALPFHLSFLLNKLHHST